MDGTLKFVKYKVGGLKTPIAFDFENQILVIFVASYPSERKSNHKNN